MKSSSRVHSMWIGVPRSWLAIMIACSACGPLPLRPNPPPRWHRWRWTFCSGTPVIFDALKRVSCGLWSPIQMSTRSLVTSTVALPGSMRARGEIGRRVGGLDDLRGTREAGVHVALIDAHAAGLIDGRQQRVAHHRAC